MKTIGIIGAMDEEIAFIKEIAEIVTAKNILGLDFYITKFGGNSVIIVKCGIGKVNAAACTQVLIDHFSVDCVINIGVAGAVYKELNIGDVVISTDALQHDMDVSALGDPVGTIPRMEESRFKADEELIALAEKAGEALENHKVFKGRVASGDQFIDSKEKKDWIHDTFDAYCTEMEGAAVAQAAYLNKVPYLIVRAISDKADDSAHMDYSEFEAKAVEHSVNLMLALVKRI